MNRQSHVLTEHIGSPKLTANGEGELSNQQVLDRDIALLTASDVEVTEVTHRSLGVGMSWRWPGSWSTCLFMKNNRIILRESLVGWAFFVCYFLAIFLLPIAFILYFALHESYFTFYESFSKNALVYVLSMVLAMVGMLSFLILKSSPLEIDFDRRVLIPHNLISLNIGGVGDSTKSAIEIGFDDILASNVSGLSTNFINYKCAVLTVKTKEIHDCSMSDITKGANVLTVGLYYLTHKSCKELRSAIDRLQAELGLG